MQNLIDLVLKFHGPDLVAEDKAGFEARMNAWQGLSAAEQTFAAAQCAYATLGLLVAIVPQIEDLKKELAQLNEARLVEAEVLTQLLDLLANGQMASLEEALKDLRARLEAK